MRAMRRVYFDYNATTPVHPAVAAFVKPFLHELFGNPSSMHWSGRDVRPYVDEAREQAASMIKAAPGEIVFTAGGTEADNQAIKGAAYCPVGEGQPYHYHRRSNIRRVLNTCRYLEGKGFSVTYLDVDGNGLVDPEDVRRAITGRDGAYLGHVREQRDGDRASDKRDRRHLPGSGRAFSLGHGAGAWGRSTSTSAR